MRTTNTGHKGITYDSRRRVYRASIQRRVAGRPKTVWTKRYTTLKEAVRGRNEELCRQMLGYVPTEVPDFCYTPKQLYFFSLCHPLLGGMTQAEAARVANTSQANVAHILSRLRRKAPQLFSGFRYRGTRVKTIPYEPFMDSEVKEKF